MATAFKTMLHGFLIGVANIIPGVSGGSLALALGIYERLIAAIGNVGPGTLAAVLGVAGFRDGARERFRVEWRRIDGVFLCWIAAGGGVAVVVFSRVIVWLLEQWHDPTYGFFSGLILVSIWMPLKMILRFGAVEGLSAVAGLGLVLALTFSADSTQQLTDAKRKIEMKRAQTEQAATPETRPSAIAGWPSGYEADCVLFFVRRGGDLGDGAAGCERLVHHDFDGRIF